MISRILIYSLMLLIFIKSFNTFIVNDIYKPSIQTITEIRLPNRTVIIDSPIIISNSNQRIIGGNDTILVLRSNANCPIIIIGLQHHTTVTNIELSNIRIDGNRKNQMVEQWKDSPYNYQIYNNGIIVQNSDDIKIKNVTSYSCKSGGLVTTEGVKRMTLEDYSAYDNEFDGLACYKTVDSTFTNLYIHNNVAAGISLDLKFDSNSFYNVLLKENDIGIFMRNSSNNLFNGLTLIRNKNYDMFVSSVDYIFGTGCSDNVYSLSHDGIIYVDYKLCYNNKFRLNP